MNIQKRGRPTMAPHAGRPGTKWCNRGKHYVLITEFRKRHDGYYAAYCKECEKAYDRTRKASAKGRAKSNRE